MVTPRIVTIQVGTPRTGLATVAALARPGGAASSRAARLLAGPSRPPGGHQAGSGEPARDGAGLATPAVVVVRVFLALIRGIKRTAPMVLSDDAKQLLEVEHWILPHAGEGERHPLQHDDGFSHVVRSYHRLSPSKREAFVAIANTVLGSLASGETPEIGPDHHGGGSTVPGRRG